MASDEVPHVLSLSSSGCLPSDIGCLGFERARLGKIKDKLCASFGVDMEIVGLFDVEAIAARKTRPGGLRRFLERPKRY